MFNRIVLALFFLLLSSRFCYANAVGNWNLVKNDKANGIDVYLRILPNGNVEFKGITTLNTSLSSIVALFKDIDSMSRWVYRTKKVMVLKEISHQEVYVYTIHTMPFPFTKRDSIVHSTIRQDPESLTVTIRGQAAPDYLPGKKGYIRIRAVKSFWSFEPQAKGNVRITFQGYGDPGGSIPSSIYRSPVFHWLSRFFLWELPYYTLKNMQVIIHDKKYQTQTFSFIKEPIQR